jgi:hypothetical protein
MGKKKCVHYFSEKIFWKFAIRDNLFAEGRMIKRLQKSVARMWIGLNMFTFCVIGVKISCYDVCAFWQMCVCGFLGLGWPYTAICYIFEIYFVSCHFLKKNHFVDK